MTLPTMPHRKKSVFAVKGTQNRLDVAKGSFCDGSTLPEQGQSGFVNSVGMSTLLNLSDFALYLLVCVSRQCGTINNRRLTHRKPV